MDDNPLQQRFHHIAESALLSCLEPSPIQFRQEHEGGAARIVFAIRRASADEPVALRSRVNRNGFLLGCCNYTDRRTEEHLIVGYGFRQASTTRIERVHHVVGDSNSVPIPPAVAQAALDHYNKNNDNEVIFFHNHPRWWLNLVFDNTPLASPADRNLLARAVMTPQQLLRTLAKKGRVLFYLGENGFVQQFRLPSFISLFRAVPPPSRAHSNRRWLTPGRA